MYYKQFTADMKFYSKSENTGSVRQTPSAPSSSPSKSSTPSISNGLPTLWHTTVDKVVVNADGSVVFHFKNGSEIEA